ncbi:hypothetical protein Pd630_LPD10036 (plasmid) [Rhodococcus opacus PD630]|nr:hypothetical protein Pd630_LPD10036 [Rhodococcus opacus PD630]
MTNTEEVPVLSLPREDLMRLVMAMRVGADVLRRAREKSGRSAFEDAENIARKEAVAAAEGLRKFTPTDTEEWNAAAREGRVFAEQHADSGMTVRVAPLSDGRFGVQAGWTDNNTSTVVGSARMADDIRSWLRNNSTHEAVNDLRNATTEVHDSVHGDLDRAKEWMAQPGNEMFRKEWDSQDRWWRDYDTSKQRDAWLVGEWEDARLRETRSAADRAAVAWLGEPENEEMATRFMRWQFGGFSPSTESDPLGRTPTSNDRQAWLRDQWHKATGQDGETFAAQDTLADRIRGRVPDSVLGNDRWVVAEEQFRTLVEQGADPELLADTVAGIDFNNGIRSPSGFAAWAMRTAAKKGRVHRSDENTSEEQAKREVAEEWLAQADADNPLDRARAAQLVGQIDDPFDAEVAKKFPGILDGDRDADLNTAQAEAARHESNARTAEAAAERKDVEDRVIVIDSHGNAQLSFDPFSPAEAAQDRSSTSSSADRPGQPPTIGEDWEEVERWVVDREGKDALSAIDFADRSDAQAIKARMHSQWETAQATEWAQQDSPELLADEPNVPDWQQQETLVAQWTAAGRPRAADSAGDHTYAQSETSQAGQSHEDASEAASRLSTTAKRATGPLLPPTAAPSAHRGGRRKPAAHTTPHQARVPKRTM